MDKGSKIKFASVFVASILLCTVFAFINDDSGELDGRTFIIHTNDTHGYYEENLSFSQVAGLRDHLESLGATVFLMDAGDTFQGSSVTMMTHGESSVSVMNAVGYDVMCPGNHEFDYTVPTYLGYVERLDFPTISSNIIWKDSGDYVFDPYVVLEKNGVRLGVFSLTTTVTPEEATPGIVDELLFTDPVSAAQDMVGVLSAMDCDYIICLGHLGVNHNEGVPSDYVCSQVEGIDLFIDGHSHTAMSGGKVVDGSVILYDSDTVIASTGAYLQNIGIVSLDGDDIDAELLSEVPYRDKTVETTIGAELKSVDETLSQVIGRSEVTLDGERTPSRLHESTGADYVLDALMEYADADIAIANGGTFRGSIKPGDVTVNDVYTMMPFENYAAVKNLTGQQILDGLENGLSMLPDPVGRYLQVSGMTVIYDSSQESGHRVVSVKVGDTDLDLQKTYRVVSSNYVLNGGDGFTMFVDGGEIKLLELINDVVIKHIKNSGTITSADVHTGRLTDLSA